MAGAVLHALLSKAGGQPSHPAVARPPPPPTSDGPDLRTGRATALRISFLIGNKALCPGFASRDCLASKRFMPRQMRFALSPPPVCLASIKTKRGSQPDDAPPMIYLSRREPYKDESLPFPPLPALAVTLRRSLEDAGSMPST